MKKIFIVGAPRSGTTWLQILFAQHPRIVSSSETHIYTQYLSLLEKRWEHEKRRSALGYKVSGLTRIVDENAFYEATRAFAERIYGQIALGSDADAALLDKTPENLLHAGHILRHFPDAFFVHIVRDPRAVVASFKSASRSWWGWTESGTMSICDRWRRDVAAGRAIARATSNYREVHYEDLLDQGPGVLSELFEFVEEPLDLEACRSIYERCSLENLQSSREKELVQPWDIASEPKNFFRRGRSDGWRIELSAYAVHVTQKRLSAEMSELGYEALPGRERRAYSVALLELRYLLARIARQSLASIKRLSKALKAPMGGVAKRL